MKTDDMSKGMSVMVDDKSFVDSCFSMKFGETKPATTEQRSSDPRAWPLRTLGVPLQARRPFFHASSLRNRNHPSVMRFGHS
ncbi:MAG: hypothetical protein HOH66_00570 [Rhodospirillaceae bacterium]|nr:hypothetical protein [Rhodospirillaceae bacterium]MBT6116342.1 hypothetical protein [Rhodospirillaceae bacterium]